MFINEAIRFIETDVLIQTIICVANKIRSKFRTTFMHLHLMGIKQFPFTQLPKTRKRLDSSFKVAAFPVLFLRQRIQKRFERYDRDFKLV